MKQNFNSLLIIKIFYKAVFGIAIYAFLSTPFVFLSYYTSGC